MKSIIEWLIAIVCIAFMACVFFWLPYYFERISNKEQLPYTRPHIELMKPDGTLCAAWIVPQSGVYVMICEHEGAQFIPIGQFNQYQRQNMGSA